MKETILAAKKSGRCAVIPFITAGFPSRDSFWDTLVQVDAAGADIIEIGIPFSDPVADGPVIEEISREVLAFAGGVLDDLDDQPPGACARHDA